MLGNKIISEEIDIKVIYKRVLSMALILLFVFLADALLSFWVPVFLEDSYSNSLTVGLIMSFSSLVGLGADLVIPQLLKNITVRKLILSGILLSLGFSGILFGTTFFPFILLSLLAMAVWGLYYEFLGFAQQQFVSESTPVKFHPLAWGLIGVFKSFAYFLGPLIAGSLYDFNQKIVLYIAIFFLMIALLILVLFSKSHSKKLDIETSSVNLLRELSHWKLLFSKVWPIVILSVFIGLIDATFWTVGPILSESLSKKSFFGGWFLSVYMIPSLFMGFLIAKWGIYKGKKKIAEAFLLFSGISLSLFALSDLIALKLVIVFVSSVLLGVVFPLTEATYSDIIQRMGREKSHLIGLSNSTFSLAYIIGPTLSGFIAQEFGQDNTFSIMGVICIVIAVMLLLTTPKKLHLPQKEIHKWD